MDEPKNNTCAVLDADKRRLARGRFDLLAAERQVTFAPASNVTPEEMAKISFLWPDGEEAITVTGARPDPTSPTRFVMDISP